MKSLRQTPKQLNVHLLDALGDLVHDHSGVDSKPFEIDMGSPLPHRVRIYIYTLTHPPGGRTLGEHKIQVILPDHSNRARSNFDNSDGRFVLLMGFEPELKVFALWDAGLYTDIPYSRNVQIKPETVYEAYSGRVAMQERRLRGGVREVVIAARRDYLVDAVVARLEVTVQRLVGDVE
jgi:hypothetical protein